MPNFRFLNGVLVDPIDPHFGKNNFFKTLLGHFQKSETGFESPVHLIQKVPAHEKFRPA